MQLINGHVSLKVRYIIQYIGKISHKKIMGSELIMDSKKGIYGRLLVVVFPVIIVVEFVVFVIETVDAELLVWLTAVSAELFSTHLTLGDVFGFFSTYCTYWHIYFTPIAIQAHCLLLG